MRRAFSSLRPLGSSCPAPPQTTAMAQSSVPVASTFHSPALPSVRAHGPGVAFAAPSSISCSLSAGIVIVSPLGPSSGRFWTWPDAGDCRCRDAAETCRYPNACRSHACPWPASECRRTPFYERGTRRSRRRRYRACRCPRLWRGLGSGVNLHALPASGALAALTLHQAIDLTNGLAEAAGALASLTLDLRTELMPHLRAPMP